jgi:hypothetical protein
VRDFIDESAKERLMMIAQAAMQNQLIDMMDFLKIETAKTYSELMNQIEYAMNKKQRKAEEQQQMQMMQQQAMMEQQMAMQQQQAQMKEEGQNYRTGVKAAVDMEKNGTPAQGAEAAAAGEEVAAEAPAPQQ